MASTRGVRVLAPAKINLHLRIGPPRADGFHGLLSWMTTVELFDTLTLSTGAAGPFAMELKCDDPSLPCDQSNLVVRAGKALAQTLGGKTTDRMGQVSATLQKRIPAGAGLGGGSSDAAGTLLGLNRLWNSSLDPAALADLAVNLGSDIPFFFYAPSAICTGRGQWVRPTPPPAARWAVLFLTGIHMPTPAVYKQFDRMKLWREEDLRSEPDWAAWAKLAAGELLAVLVNDLEAPAFALCPELQQWRERLSLALKRPVLMSGSGSALFTLCDTDDEARAAAEVAGKLGVRAVVVTVAPTPGEITDF